MKTISLNVDEKYSKPLRKIEGNKMSKPKERVCTGLKYEFPSVPDVKVENEKGKIEERSLSKSDGWAEA